MEELKPCPFCGNFLKTSSDAICSFGKDFPDDRPQGAMLFCLRHDANGDVLHAEAISIDDDDNECCEYSGNAEINFCPICGKPLTTAGKKVLASRHAELENKPLTCDGCRWLSEFGNLGEDISDICWECARYQHSDHYVRKPEGSENNGSTI